MLFAEDQEREGWMLIDRGIDDKVDEFRPCEPCFEINTAIRDVAAEPDEAWSDLSLCPDCQTEFENKSTVDAYLDRRLDNLDCDLSKLPEEGPWPDMDPFQPV